VLGHGFLQLLDNAPSSTRKALGAPTGVCPNCWHVRVVVGFSDASETRWRVFLSLSLGPAMLTNLELDGELDVIHACRPKHDFDGLFPLFFNPTFVLALKRTAADVRGGGGGELGTTYIESLAIRIHFLNGGPGRFESYRLRAIHARLSRSTATTYSQPSTVPMDFESRILTPRVLGVHRSRRDISSTGASEPSG